MKPFQIGVLIGSVLLVVLSLLFFAGILGGKKSQIATEGSAPLLVWGTFESESMAELIKDIRSRDKSFNVTYVPKNALTLEDELTRALADNKAPDLIIYPHELLRKLGGRFMPLSYEQFPERTFRDSFIPGAELYLFGDGIYALPMAVDPVVMYWNRRALQSAGEVSPPTEWEQLFALVSKFTKNEGGGDVSRSFVAMGASGNVDHLVPLLSALIMQTGDRIITDVNGTYRVVFGATRDTASVIRFFNTFSNPSLKEYTWNAALPPSRTAFGAEKLVLYFGLASDQGVIAQENPNLEYDIAPIPQLETGALKSTFGRIYGVSIIKTTTKPIRSAAALGQFSTVGAPYIYENLGLSATYVPDLGQNPSDAFATTIEDSAKLVRVWLDPNPEETLSVFKDLIDQTSIRGVTPESGVAEAKRRLINILGEK